MSELNRIILSSDATKRNKSLDQFCRNASAAELVEECASLEALRHQSPNLYERVRALFFLSAIHRYYLPAKLGVASEGTVPFLGYTHHLQRRFEEAVHLYLGSQTEDGPNIAISSALAATYRDLGFQTLADQVRRSVRSARGSQWMFRTGHPADYPLRLRPELLQRDEGSGLYPVLRESTPVRMDFSHSGWSDIFFLGMDYPEGARVLNVSIDLAVRGAGNERPQPPVECYFRVIDEPVVRLTSVDLGATADVTSLSEVFDFGRDYLGLLKAALIGAGVIPPGLEGSGERLSSLLARLTGRAGHGIEIVSKVNDIPKGSRLAVSTTLLACLISVSMRATAQIEPLTGGLVEGNRRLIAARAVLGEWLGGSGGGWQDSGGIWPGIKLIRGVCAEEGDVEFGVSRGCLLPRHHVFSTDEISLETRDALQKSLVLVHGGMAQDVGPVLEMVTEKYLLRGSAEWQGRQEAIALLDEIIECLRRGDIRGIGARTQRNFDGPIQTIIPWAANHYTLRLTERVRQQYGEGFWGFWMLGGMAGGGMGFLFDPKVKDDAHDTLREVMREIKTTIDRAVPFAMEPVVYNFSINERGTWCELFTGTEALLPAGYYTFHVPVLLRRDLRTLSRARRKELEAFSAACHRQSGLSGTMQTVLDRLLPRDDSDGADGSGSLPALLAKYGFDRTQHEEIRADLKSGRIGLARNCLPASTTIEDVSADEIADARRPVSEEVRRLGKDALRDGAVGVVTFAGGIGTRWTKGAGVVKALNPFARFGGRHRSFVEIHLAKSRRSRRFYGCPAPHVFTTSYLTHAPLSRFLAGLSSSATEEPLYLSEGRSVGLRMVPTMRDLRFAWEEMPQQILDEQSQKLVESVRAALIEWAVSAGEASDYTDNLPEQCLHPVGHWYEIPNMLRNGTLLRLLEEHPRLKYLMVHNIDTLGADLDPALLGLHISSGAALTTEVIARQVEDRGGGLARIGGRTQLIEGLALPSEDVEFRLTFYNTGTMWIELKSLLETFGLSRDDLADQELTTAAVRRLAARMPTYVTLKDVKKRWGKGQEDIFPVTQFEKLWGDMTSLPELDCRYVAVPRLRGQQLKGVEQLDGWWRDGSAAHVESLCDWDNGEREV